MDTIDLTMTEYAHRISLYPDLSGRSFRAHNLSCHFDIQTNSINLYDE
ncbi:hypothetical protein HMPREF1989_00148 [Porphyromonas gingivalis F0566]|nr:hypothetical protein HMPREF1989_00148 [Porphyromonas gingivalis F0566]